MPATYDDYEGDFRVDLWEENKGYSLDLDQDCSQPLDESGLYMLSPGISRNSEDNFLDQYSRLFGNLSSYTKIG